MTTTAETTKTVQVNRVYIKATPQAIWDAITKPEWTEKYGYAPLVEYELRAGGKFRAYPNEGMKALGMPDSSSMVRCSRLTLRAGSSRPGVC